MLRYSTNLRNSTKKWFQLILGLLTVTVLITLSDTAATNQKNEFHDNCRTKCYTDKCTDEALNFIKIMNEQADPCDNFYEFVCGNYIKDTVLPPTDNAASKVVDIQNAIGQDVFRDLEEEVKDSDWDAFKKVKTYYQNCMNTERTEITGTRPLLKLLNAVGGWPVVLGNRWDERRFDLWQALFRFKAMRTPSFFPVAVAIDIDNTDSRKYAIKLANGQINANTVWFSDPSDPNKVSRIFFNTMLKVATFLGARNDSTTRRELQQVLDFEINLYKISTPAEQLVSLPLEEMRMTIRDLARKSPAVPWLELINRILGPTGQTVSNNEYIYTMDPKFITEVSKLIERTPRRVLANFIAWRIAQISLTYMPEPLRSVGNEYDNIMEGSTGEGEQDRSSNCYEEVSALFPVGLSSMYVNRHFNEPIQEQVNQMFENIRAQARKNLQQNDWMDAVTRQRALEKLDAMTVTIGYAEELRDRRKVDDYYRQVEINPGLSLESGFNMSYFSEQKQLSNLRKSTLEDKWTTKQSVTDLNAYNLVQENSIELPAGFLKYFFALDKPQFINYGTAGAFIGHEIFHGFDNQGRQFDRRGNQVNWWTPEAEEKFQKKAQCIIDQYSNFTVPGVNTNVNGERSQGENIADNGGFRAAYLAYKEWSRRHNDVEGCLPSLNYTPEQMFWISSASIWCAKERPEYVIASMTTDEHSPNVARVNVVMSNIKEFAEDFKCRPGSKMNPYKKCKVW